MNNDLIDELNYTTTMLDNSKLMDIFDESVEVDSLYRKNGQFVVAKRK